MELFVSSLMGFVGGAALGSYALLGGRPFSEAMLLAGGVVLIVFGLRP